MIVMRDLDWEVGSEEHGFYVTVTTVGHISEGQVRSRTGAVVFSVGFKCIVFSLVKNEVVENDVTQVMEYGLLASMSASSPLPFPFRCSRYRDLNSVSR